MPEIVWRDDDIDVITRGDRLDQLRSVDDIFQYYRVPHTIAVIAKRIAENRELIELVRERRMIVQLHCWNHEDLRKSVALDEDLRRGRDELESVFGQRPTVLYPPWNKTSSNVQRAAANAGLRVSTRKSSIEQFIRFRGQIGEGVVNFHYWNPSDAAQLDPALAIYTRRQSRLKKTDYAPRAAPFDTFLTGTGLVGVEVGVDVGAHAEAMLTYCDIRKLYLVDRWPREYYYGWCEGRLRALGFWPRVGVIQATSSRASERFADGTLDFVYIDEETEHETVAANLQNWWPKVKVGGILGYRAYSSTPTPLKEAVDAFVAKHEITATAETGEIILSKERK